MTLLWRATKMFFSALWIAVAFNGFKGCLISSAISRISHFISQLDTSDPESHDIVQAQLGCYTQGVLALINHGISDTLRGPGRHLVQFQVCQVLQHRIVQGYA